MAEASYHRRRGGGAIPENVITVDQNATGAGDGSTWEDAYTTRQDAYDAVDGTTKTEIWVAAGTYGYAQTYCANVGEYGGFAGTETSRDERNVSANQTILDGGGTGFVSLMDHDGWTIDGFTIQNTADWAALRWRYHGGTVRNCTFSNCGNSGAGNNSPGAIVFAGDGVVENCIFDDCENNGNAAASPYPCQAINNISANCKLTLLDCIFKNCAAGSGGLAVLMGSAPSMTNVLAYDNDCGSSALFRIRNAAGAVYNCTIVNNTGIGVLQDGSGSGTIYNSIVRGNTTDVSGMDTVGYNNYSGGSGTNQDTDPLFVGGGDYSLQSGSPCRDAGNNMYVTESYDLAGNPRISNTTVDQGAYEYQV